MKEISPEQKKIFFIYIPIGIVLICLVLTVFYYAIFGSGPAAVQSQADINLEIPTVNKEIEVDKDKSYAIAQREESKNKRTSPLDLYVNLDNEGNVDTPATTERNSMGKAVTDQEETAASKRRTSSGGMKTYKPRTPVAKTKQQDTPPKTVSAASTAEDELERKKTLMANGFSIGSTPATAVAPGNQIPVVTFGRRTLTSGQTLVTRVTNDSNIGNVFIPKNTLIHCRATLDRNRVQLTVTSLRIGEQMYAVNLVGYGSDGMTGIPIQIDENEKLISNEVVDAATSTLQRSVLGETRLGDLATGIARGTERNKQKRFTVVENQQFTLVLNK